MVTKKQLQEQIDLLENQVKITADLEKKNDNLKYTIKMLQLQNQEQKIDIKEAQQNHAYDTLINKKVLVFYKQYLTSSEDYTRYDYVKREIDEKFSYLQECHRQALYNKAINTRSCTGIVETIQNNVIVVRVESRTKTWKYCIPLCEIKNVKEYWRNEESERNEE